MKKNKIKSKKSKIKHEVRIGYVDVINFQHHIGDDRHPTMIFSSKELALEGQPCSKHCGIYKVQIKVLKVAHKGAWGKRK